MNAEPVGSSRSTVLSLKFTLTHPSSRSTARSTSGTARGSTRGVRPREAREGGWSVTVGEEGGK